MDRGIGAVVCEKGLFRRCVFQRDKIVYSLLDETPADAIDPEFLRNSVRDGIKGMTSKDFLDLRANTNLLHKIGIANSDAVIFNNRTPDPELVEYVESSECPCSR